MFRSKTMIDDDNVRFSPNIHEAAMNTIARAWDGVVSATGPAGFLTLLTTSYMLGMCVAFGAFDYFRWSWVSRFKIQPGKYPSSSHVRLGLLLAFLNGIVIHVPSTLMFPAEKMGIRTDSATFPEPGVLIVHVRRAAAATAASRRCDTPLTAPTRVRLAARNHADR